MNRVMLATDGSPTAAKATASVFGSVSTGVLHHATCPVLVLRGETSEDAAPSRLHQLTHA